MSIDADIPVRDPAEDYHADDGYVFTGRLLPVGRSRQLEFERVIDVEHFGFFDKRWIVSRKKNRTLGDYTNQWRKAIIEKATEQDDGLRLGESLDAWT